MLSISRSGLYYTPKGEHGIDHVLMWEIDQAFTEWPFLGVRQMRNYLRLRGYRLAGPKSIVLAPFQHHGYCPGAFPTPWMRTFCVAAPEEALAKHGKTAIFNTDQSSQFTRFTFTNDLRENGIRISMDGRGRWLDSVFIERLWRSLKYECVYLKAFETGSEARLGIGRWIDFYNRLRPHTALEGITPDMFHELNVLKAA